MKIPPTNSEHPYIEFRICPKGKIKLSATSAWWGGKNCGFTCSDGSHGNTCKPKDLKLYLKAYREKLIKDIEKEMYALQKKLEKIKSEPELWHF